MPSATAVWSALEGGGVLVDAIVVQRAKIAQDFIEHAFGSMPLPLQHPAKLLGIVGELPRLAAPLTNVTRIELTAEPSTAAIAVAAAVGDAAAERVAIAVRAVLGAVAGVAVHPAALLALLATLALLACCRPGLADPAAPAGHLALLTSGRSDPAGPVGPADPAGPADLVWPC